MKKEKQLSHNSFRCAYCEKAQRRDNEVMIPVRWILPFSENDSAVGVCFKCLRYGVAPNMTSATLTRAVTTTWAKVRSRPRKK